ncbi:MAG: hypothetical protein ACXW1W_06195, partial [Methylococcaceae bacterium]
MSALIIYSIVSPLIANCVTHVWRINFQPIPRKKRLLINQRELNAAKPWCVEKIKNRQFFKTPFKSTRNTHDYKISTFPIQSSRASAGAGVSPG